MKLKAVKFKDETERQQFFITQLEDLKEHLGWQILCRALDENIKTVDDEIDNLESEMIEKLGENPNNYVVKLAILRSKRDDRTSLKDLPATIIAECKGEEGFPPELDPYL